MENQNPEEEARVEQMIDELMRKAKIASQEYMKLDQETVDNITKAMSMAGLEHHMELAKMAVEETGRGIYEDKIGCFLTNTAAIVPTSAIFFISHTPPI